MEAQDFRSLPTSAAGPKPLTIGTWAKARSQKGLLNLKRGKYGINSFIKIRTSARIVAGENEARTTGY
ncbi:hypothetical protein M405DRAFT_870418 [Rhizopogon salebrosus TDB-379]|nr:hypothetical protein M405DRAFT_870418 [Rhizopogon salebrosus TDB-379]